MSDIVQDNPPQDSEQTEQPDTYLVHNIAHSRHTRERRLAYPEHRATVNQHLPGTQKRVLPGRSVQVERAEIEEFREEYRTSIGAGLLMVTNQHNQELDIDSFEIIEPDAHIIEPRPSFRLDSAAYDQNPQERMPTNEDQPPRPEHFVMPVNPHPASLDETNPATLFDQGRLEADTLKETGELPEGIVNPEPVTPEESEEQKAIDEQNKKNLEDIAAYSAEKNLQAEESSLVTDLTEQSTFPVEPVEEDKSDEKASGKKGKGKNKS